jgi:rhodanese-related sulfurtransferase
MEIAGFAVLLVAVLWVAARIYQGRNQSVISAQQRLSPSQYQAEFSQPKAPHLLVDVRTAGEFQEGHIPGAVNIDLQRLAQRLGEIPRDQPVVLYCRSGSRSATAAGLLARAGYVHVYDLGGIITWRAQGLPVR